MKTGYKKLIFLLRAAMIASVYALLTLVVPIASFGGVQLRFAEALCILPLFDFSAVPGLTLGCALANLIGFAMGLNPAGIFDTLFGALATLFAALLVYLTGRKLPGKKGLFLSQIFPVLLNAVIVGFEISFVFFGSLNPEILFLNMAQVGAGELISCYLLGVPLYYLFLKTGLSKKLFS